MSMEVRILLEKAPVTTDTQTKQFGNFVKNGEDQSTLTMIFQASVRAVVSDKPSFER